MEMEEDKAAAHNPLIKRLRWISFPFQESIKIKYKVLHRDANNRNYWSIMNEYLSFLLLSYPHAINSLFTVCYTVVLLITWAGLVLLFTLVLNGLFVNYGLIYCWFIKNKLKKKVMAAAGQQAQ